MFLARASIAAFAAFGFAVAHASSPVVVDREVPYANPEEIQPKVRQECTELNTQIAAYTKEFAAEKGVEVVFGDSASDQGRVLRMQITEAVSRGNAFIGHNKGSSARGTLYQDGEKVASFRATRYSMGGFGAGFKGSCSVLGRTMRALGKDIGYWLADPVDEAWLGDQ